jgi:hypothetical protein
MTVPDVIRWGKLLESPRGKVYERRLVHKNSDTTVKVSQEKVHPLQTRDNIAIPCQPRRPD